MYACAVQGDSTLKSEEWLVLENSNVGVDSKLAGGQESELCGFRMRALLGVCRGREHDVLFGLIEKDGWPVRFEDLEEDVSDLPFKLGKGSVMNT